jgi:hypothetical protein
LGAWSRLLNFQEHYSPLSSCALLQIHLWQHYLCFLGVALFAETQAAPSCVAFAGAVAVDLASQNIVYIRDRQRASLWYVTVHAVSDAQDVQTSVSM